MSDQLNAAQILEARDYELEQVDTPEWGGHLHVRTMDAESRDDYDRENYELGAAQGDEDEEEPQEESSEFMVNMRARLCVRCICDADGNLLFTPEQAADLGRKSAKVVDRVFDVARRLNGIGTEEEKAAEGN